MPNVKIYETESLSLMPYLQMNGLNYIGKRAENNGERARVILQFDDPRGLGPDLAMSWINSKEKQYRDLWVFFRDQIDQEIRKINRK